MQICCNIPSIQSTQKKLVFAFIIVFSNIFWVFGGSSHFPCFLLKANTFPRGKHKSKVKFFTRTQLSVKNVSFTCAHVARRGARGPVSQPVSNNSVIGFFVALPSLKQRRIKLVLVGDLVRKYYRIKTTFCHLIVYFEAVPIGQILIVSGIW